MCGSPSGPTQIHAVRIAAGGARLLLGCDLVVSASADALSKLEPGHSRAIVNSHEIDHRRLHPQPGSGVPDGRDWSAASPRRPVPATPSLSTRRGWRPAFSAIRSPAICSCSAMPISAGWCRCRPRRSSARSNSNGVAVEFNRSAFALGPARRGRSALGRGARNPGGGDPAEPPPVANPRSE